jgi:hypothetical protein
MLFAAVDVQLVTYIPLHSGVTWHRGALGSHVLKTSYLLQIRCHCDLLYGFIFQCSK